MENQVKGLRDQLDRNVSEDLQRVTDLETVAGWIAAPTKTYPHPSLQNLGLLPYMVTDVTQDF